MALLSLAASIGPNPKVTGFPAVNTFTLASITMPGKWTLLDAEKQYGWQIQKGLNLSGAFVFPTGDELVIPRFRGEFWASPDVAFFRQVRKQLFAKAVFSVGGNLKTAAMGIGHPELKALGVTDVVVGRIKPLVQERGGLWVTGVEFIQYRPRILGPATPTQTIPDKPPPQPTAVDAYDIEMQNARARAASLVKRL